MPISLSPNFKQLLYYLLLEAGFFGLIAIAYLIISGQYGEYLTTKSGSHIITLLALNLFYLYLIKKFKFIGFNFFFEVLVMHDAVWYIFYVLRYGGLEYLLLSAFYLVIAWNLELFSITIFNYTPMRILELVFFFLAYDVIWFSVGFPITYFENHYFVNTPLAHTLEILSWVIPIGLIHYRLKNLPEILFTNK